MTTITVKASATYNVHVGQELLAKAGALAAQVLSPCKALILSDDNVAPLYADKLSASLADAGFVPEVYVVPHGEGSKSLSTLSALLEHLAQKQYTRTDALFALGGGVAGDLCGFTASVYLRGVPFVQVPTSLLAAVDSSVGGKTAVNLGAGKNLAGAFYQPRLVICDTDAFATLPRDEYYNGCAEIVKYAVLDKSLFCALQSGANPASEQIIAHCVGIKSYIVEQDEFDTGMRRLLNLGHTPAHALELCTDYMLAHGAAVAVGTTMMMRAAVAHGLCAKSDLDALKALNEQIGLSTECPCTASEMAAAACSDKKREGGTLTLILPYAIGDCRPYPIPVAELEAWFASGLY